MARMQIAHGWHEHVIGFALQTLAQGGNGVNDVHF